MRLHAGPIYCCEKLQQLRTARRPCSCYCVATAIALAQDSAVLLGAGNSVASPLFTQYTAVWPKLAVEVSNDPTAYTSLPESAIPVAQVAAGEFVKLLGRGSVVPVPFIQYAALVSRVVSFVPLPAIYTLPPATVIPSDE